MELTCVSVARKCFCTSEYFSKDSYIVAKFTAFSGIADTPSVNNYFASQKSDPTASPGK